MGKKIFLLLAFALSACATQNSNLPSSRQHYYLVMEYDNIHSIAFAHEISTTQLQQANLSLKPSTIVAGMRLVIPATATVNKYPAVSNEFIWPLKHIDVSSYFGPRNGKQHKGIDLRAPRGTSILASASGKVIFAGRRSGYGRMLIIDHGDGHKTSYAHNDKNLVRSGQRVTQGEVIGRVGRTGNATGNHVHFELRRFGKPLDPMRHVVVGE